jgi:prohibitin 1
MQNLGVDWDERVLPSIGSEVVKAVVAQYNAESLLTKREEVSNAVSQSLRMRAKDFNIILDDVSITHLSFSQEFTKAVESKQVAEQDAQRAQFVVQKAEQVPCYHRSLYVASIKKVWLYCMQCMINAAYFVKMNHES